MGSIYLMPLAANIVKDITPGVSENGAIHDIGTREGVDAGISIADWMEFSDIEQQTFLASYKTARFFYHDMNTGDDVGHAYTIFSSSYPGVLDKYIELEQKANDMKRDDQWKDAWGSDAVYVSRENHLSRYLIEYKGTVLDVQVYDTLSETQMKQISARLHPVRANQ